MATIITHPLVPVAVAYLIGRDKIPPRLLIAACIVSILPDLDIIAFRFGIPYGDPFGHRGFSHSLAFAAMVGLIGVCFRHYFKASISIIFTMLFIGSASHGVLDALTDGGQGVAFFWPFNNERYFFPVRPIEVSPIGLRNFLTPRGMTVLWSEFILIWIPTFLFLIGISITRKKKT